MSRFIDGQDRRQVTLLPECLNNFIANDNPVRAVDAFIGGLDMVALRTLPAPITAPQIQQRHPMLNRKKRKWDFSGTINYSQGSQEPVD
jgi:transposase